MRSFHKYYSGEAVAPYPTLFSKSLWNIHELHRCPVINAVNLFSLSQDLQGLAVSLRGMRDGNQQQQRCLTSNSRDIRAFGGKTGKKSREPT